MDAGQRLRNLREQLGLTIREVETASSRLAAKYGNSDFAIAISRLSDIETKSVVPSIFRLYSLSVIYRRDYRELLSWYGIDLDHTAEDFGSAQPAKTHMLPTVELSGKVSVPVRLDPGFNLARTTNLGRMIERWGIVPLAYLQQFANADYTYGYIGLGDFTMYPILLPGSFVQVDESRSKVVEQMWRSEYERPIYFIETKEGFFCSWCSLRGSELLLQPHPLSPVQPRTLKSGTEAEVLGQVVGVAMRLADWYPGDSEKAPRARRQLN